MRRVIISFISLFTSLLLPALPVAALAASGAETYRAKCALCHDGGATSAPRVGQPADWAARTAKGYSGLLRSALQGVPGTAMLPKAGFPELSESEVAEAVRYMVTTAGLQLKEPAKPQPTAEQEIRRPVLQVDDVTLAVSVGEAISASRIGGVQIEARDGRVTLKGVVDDAAAVTRALAAARRVAGVRDIENRLVPADLFEHD